MISLSTFYILLSTFVLGAVIGSFLNVVILRHEKREGLNGRSHCPTCKKTLRWYELIPILSYLVQRGKCRSCGSPLSIQYPLVELATGIIFVLVAQSRLQVIGYRLEDAAVMSYPFMLFVLASILALATWSTLVVIFVYDLRTSIIPDRFSYTFAGLSLVIAFLAGFEVSSGPITYNLEPVTSSFLAGALLFIPFFGLWYFSNGRWIGFGDGKLALGIGFLLGMLPGLSAVMFAFWIGAAVSLALIGVARVTGWHKARTLPPADALLASPSSLTLKSEVPFGPFLVLGTALVYFLHWTALPPF